VHDAFCNIFVGGQWFSFFSRNWLSISRILFASLSINLQVHTFLILIFSALHLYRITHGNRSTAIACDGVRPWAAGGACCLAGMPTWRHWEVFSCHGCCCRQSGRSFCWHLLATTPSRFYCRPPLQHDTPYWGLLHLGLLKIHLFSYCYFCGGSFLLLNGVLGIYRCIDERSIRMSVHRHVCAQLLWFWLLIIRRRCWYILKRQSICCCDSLGRRSLFLDLKNSALVHIIK
jgi:hypothetical protein